MSGITERLKTAIADRYVIERELGQGGMATVYLAHDVKHDRKVALKVLRPELAAVIGAERFLQEIKVTANLQHSHILPLYDSGAAEGFLFYVMPYVEGETLRTKLTREKQLGVDQAVAMTRAIAAALDHAHRQGVIHRDIKPENVLLRDDDPLIADFGIALALSHAGGTRLTETGLSIGTPHYMSPEQAMGDREMDARSDVYSLGAMLYEMLTGDPPYTGSTAQAIVAKVITEKAPPVTMRRDTVPEHVSLAVAKALNKLPADRFGSAAAFAEALVTPGSVTPTRATAAPTAGSTVGRPPRGTLLAIAAAVAVVSAGVGLLIGRGTAPAPPAPVSRFVVTLEEGALTYAYDAPAISPDGRYLAYAEANGGLLVRARDRLEGTAVPGGENAWSPFFSPDGSTLAFMTGFPGALMTTALSGGRATALVPDSVHGDGGSWSDDGWIYYPGTVPGGLALMRVAERGGTREVVAMPDTANDELFFVWPDALPGGRTVLATLWRRRGGSDVVAVDVASGTTRVLTNGVRGLYAPTGHLIIVRGDGTVHAARFDADAAELRGRPVQLSDGVAVGLLGRASVGISRSGTLLYQTNPARHSVVRVLRSGTVRAVDDTWTGSFGPLDVSPGGDRLAVSMVRDGRVELWVKALDTGPFTRLAYDGSSSYRPSWSPDGHSVLFVSDRPGRSALYQVPADGSAPPELVLADPRAVDEGHMSADGRWIVYRRGSGGGRDVLARRVGGEADPVPIATSEFDEFSPELSPDGRWIAYASLESGGRPEVFVRPFPDAARARWQVSREGGSEPRWSHDGRELFYRNGNRDFVAARIADGNGGTFRVASERILFSVRDYISDDRHHAYAVAPDDQSFFFIRILPGSPGNLIVVLNWFEELKARVVE